jgi:hypothetical protein
MANRKSREESGGPERATAVSTLTIDNERIVGFQSYEVLV